jgi:hypothetical protein
MSVEPPLMRDVINGVLNSRIQFSQFGSAFQGTSITQAEVTAGVTPTNYGFPPGDVRRYGAVGDGVADDTAAIQAAIDSGINNGNPVYLPKSRNGSLGLYRTTSVLTISGRVKIYGDGNGYSGIVCSGNGVSTFGNDGFKIVAGQGFVSIESLAILQATRYTTTVNTFKAIDIQGTTAAQCEYHIYRDLFIDGFLTAIQANGIKSSTIDFVVSFFGKNGILADELTLNNTVTNCLLVGSSIAGGVGIKVGDGTNVSEGWLISSNFLVSYDDPIWFLGTQNHNVSHNILDFCGVRGVLLQSGSAASTNHTIALNYIAIIGTSGDSGIRDLNSAAASDPRGNRIVGNDILVYLFGGAVLTYGIHVDGTNVANNKIALNSVRCSGGGGFDLKVDTGTGTIVSDNTWLTTGAIFATGVNPSYSDGNTGTVSGILPSVASAAALTLPIGPKAFVITGATNITSIVATGQTGKTILLIFTGILTFTDGSNLVLNGNFVTTANATITLYCDGANFFEQARSAN